MKTTNKPEDIAARKMVIITPLLAEGLDPQRIIELKKELSERHQISYRTITRYMEAYRSNGFEGLKPTVGGSRESTLPDHYPMVVEQAIVLRRECPTRSVADIIRILELEGEVPFGSLSRSTLQRHLQAAGFGTRQMKIYTKTGAASRRFQKPHRCMLYQGDIKYGPYLPIGKGGERKQVYLSVFIDDATRYIVAAKFYDNQKVGIIEDSLRHAILLYGKPDSIYVDNGKQYRSEWLQKACTRLGIRLLFAKPYHPEGKGKVEAFNRRIDSFLSEVALQKVQTLEELNHHLDHWISEHYHKSPHYGLDGIRPETAFRTDTRPLRFIDAAECANAFLHTLEREVDKTGCISFDGQKYEVGLHLIGRKVDVCYDPTWKDEVEIRHKDFPAFRAKVMQIGTNCGVRPELPMQLQVLEPESSRLLDGLNKAKSAKPIYKEAALIFRKNREEAANV